MELDFLLNNFDTLTKEFEKSNQTEIDTDTDTDNDIEVNFNKDFRTRMNFNTLYKNKNESNEINNQSNNIFQDNRCNVCNSTSFIYEESIICENCGNIIGDIINHDKEWKYFGNNDGKQSADPSRCGMIANTILPSSSLSTTISGKNNCETYRKLHIWNSVPTNERSIITTMKDFQEKGRTMEVTASVIDRAQTIYTSISTHNCANVKRGKPRQGIIASCMIQSANDRNEKINEKNVCQLYGLTPKNITTGCKQLKETLFHRDREYFDKMKPPNTTDIIEGYSAALSISEMYKPSMIRVAKLANLLGISSENIPKSTAIASIYLVGQYYQIKHLTKSFIAKECCISEVTITKVYKNLNIFKNFLIKELFDEKYGRNCNK